MNFVVCCAGVDWMMLTPTNVSFWPSNIERASLKEEDHQQNM
jgi:hypothetical protein